MRLESDPTIIYGITKGRPLGRGIRLSELQRDTGYNTYLINGLPPTPIANPGRLALAAVLNPPRSDELFFVADGTGGHVFARTYEDHLANVARWRSIEAGKAGAPPAETLPPGSVPGAPLPGEPIPPPMTGEAVITMQAPGAVTPSRAARPTPAPASPAASVPTATPAARP